jgi:hypothetical protein
MGWGGFLDKIMDKLPIQSRVERWKNQIDQYEREKKLLLSGECDDKKSKRLLFIDTELVRLNGLCKNKAAD